MSRAIELAARGKGNVSPNPVVGCVIVHDGKIIGEGWHREYGGPHAEVNAVKSVENSELLSESTVYVTLEPCSHFGKTPPCSDLLIDSGVKEVVIANEDPFPKVAGSGIKKLRDAGINVVVGVMEEEASIINRRFLVNQRYKRPFILLKWAQTADGFIARDNYDSKWISNEYSRKLVHKWRSEEDAILAGYNTVKYDNPELNVRNWEGKNPVRVILDKKLQLKRDNKVFDQSIRTLIFNTVLDEENKNLEFIKIEDENQFLENVIGYLHMVNISSILVEGGASIHKEFIKKDLWDEARIFVSEKKFGSGIEAAKIDTEDFKTQSVFGDKLKIYLKDG